MFGELEDGIMLTRLARALLDLSVAKNETREIKHLYDELLDFNKKQCHMKQWQREYRAALLKIKMSQSEVQNMLVLQP